MTRRRGKLRIGIFGGSFDPVHNGHLQIAEEAMNQLRLDRLLFVPAFVPPHKPGAALASVRDRVSMLRIALRGKPRWSISMDEIRREGISYTVDSVRTIRSRNPAAAIYLIVGSDNAAQFKTWKDYREILREARLAVYRRTGRIGSWRAGAIARRSRILKGAKISISSTGLRRRIFLRRPISALVPNGVDRYIQKRKLYRKSR